MSNDQKPYENITRVFWIKVELRSHKLAGRQVLGNIREVISGSSSALWDLLDIFVFIIPFLEDMGLTVNWFWRFTTWLRKKVRNRFRK